MSFWCNYTVHHFKWSSGLIFLIVFFIVHLPGTWHSVTIILTKYSEENMTKDKCDISSCTRLNHTSHVNAENFTSHGVCLGCLLLSLSVLTMGHALQGVLFTWHCFLYFSLEDKDNLLDSIVCSSDQLRSVLNVKILYAGHISSVDVHHLQGLSWLVTWPIEAEQCILCAISHLLSNHLELL